MGIEPTTFGLKEQSSATILVDSPGALDKLSDLGMLLRSRLEKLAGPDAFAFSFAVPILKVDPARREVEGVATSERVDSQGESLGYEGSKKAFAALDHVPIREMHQPIAVGKAVSVIADDAARRITVRARISKGAPDTWAKLEEGVLNSFSVGGGGARWPTAGGTSSATIGQ